MINNRLYISNYSSTMRFTATSKSRTSKVYFFDFYENEIVRTFSERKTSIYCKKSTCTFIYAIIQMSGKEVRISFKPCGRHWGRPIDEMEILSSDLWTVTRVICFTNRQVLNLCIPRQIRCATLSISEYPSSAFVHLKVPKMFTKKSKTHPQLMPYGMRLMIVLSDVLGCNSITLVHKQAYISTS